MEADDSLRSVIDRYLREHGYSVYSRINAVEGLELVRTKLVDLVIVDLMLPGRSGLAVLEQIKMTNPNIPVILLADVDGEAHRALAELLGACEYLRKPFSMNRLFEIVCRNCPLHPSEANAAQTAPSQLSPVAYAS
jgi:two-component system response regulator ResD